MFDLIIILALTHMAHSVCKTHNSNSLGTQSILDQTLIALGLCVEMKVTKIYLQTQPYAIASQARVSAGVSGRRGLSGRSTNFFAQMLKAELDLIRGRYIYNVYLQMFRDASHSSLACSWLCGRLGLVNSRTNFRLQNFFSDSSKLSSTSTKR